ncbi:hypothetical protein ACFL6S_03485 [Candidatus Poribacteria bacterium]
MKDHSCEKNSRSSNDGNAQIILFVPQTPQAQFGMSCRELDENHIAADICFHHETQSDQNPRIEIRVEKCRLVFHIIGDTRPRRIHALSFGTLDCLADEENPGVVETVTKPFGDDSIGYFRLNQDLPYPPSVYIEWEQAIQIGTLGIDPGDNRDEIKLLLPDEAFDERAFFDILIDNKRTKTRVPKSTTVALPRAIKGAWRDLYDWLLLDPTCKCCSEKDLEAEARMIVMAAIRAKPQTKGKGCIVSSLTLMNFLIGGLGNHIVNVKTGTVRGINVFGTRTTRTWIRIETHCYIIENVAWWWGFFRHQAVLVYPKCDKLGFMNPSATVIDLWGPAGKVWQSWENWAGGMSEVNRTAGRVRDKF